MPAFRIASRSSTKLSTSPSAPKISPQSNFSSVFSLVRSKLRHEIAPNPRKTKYSPRTKALISEIRRVFSRAAQRLILNNQDIFKSKSLELIHLTKEFLKSKKTYEDSLGLLIAIKKARMLGKSTLDFLPQKLLPLAPGAKNLDDAERIAAVRMEELKQKMAELGSEIKKLSSQLEPFFSGLQEQQRKEIPAAASAKAN